MESSAESGLNNFVLHCNKNNCCYIGPLVADHVKPLCCISMAKIRHNNENEKSQNEQTNEREEKKNDNKIPKRDTRLGNAIAFDCDEPI